MNNMDLWNKYATPPEEALKAFDNGNFKGTDISPMWRIRCLTEEFGPCGIGWYAEVVEHWADETWTSDIEHCVTTHVRIRLYYVDKETGAWSKPVEAVGGNTMTQYSRKYKSTRASDEAYKMAYTDALGGACKLLGIGGAVYWERGYSKYENAYTDGDTANQQTPPPAPAPAPAPASVPVPVDTPEEAQYRILCLRKAKLAGLNASCLRRFGTDFAHTPVSQIKTYMTPEIIALMPDLGQAKEN